MRQNLATYLFFCGALWATGVQAGCPQGQEAFTSCQIEGRTTEIFVCFDDQVATYRYGPIGSAPDLFLSETIEQVDFEPWSGSGKAISESVTFYNGEYSYDVFGGFDRPFSEEEMRLPIRRFGGIEVKESGERVSSLACIPETVSYGFGGGIHDIKVAAGQTWDPYSFTWMSEPTQPPAKPILMENYQYDVVEDCLPASEFSLGGVQMGAPSATLGKLGSVEMVHDPNGVGEEIERMILVDMQIDILQDKVFGMSTTSPIWQMPSGIAVGMTRGDVIHILGRTPNGSAATAQRFFVNVCSSERDAEDEWGALIAFGQNKRVESISLMSPSF